MSGRRVALTGGIGSGKSTVATLLRERGAVVIDADQIARDLMEPGGPLLAEVVEAFGPEVLHPDGRLDRAALAARVFNDPARLAVLNGITHPPIAERTAELLRSAPPEAVVVYDMPLLVEQNVASGWDHVVVVETPLPLRLQRLAQDRGMTAAEAEARMAAQASDEQRRAVADTVIVNDGDTQALAHTVADLWSRLIDQRSPD